MSFKSHCSLNATHQLSSGGEVYDFTITRVDINPTPSLFTFSKRDVIDVVTQTNRGCSLNMEWLCSQIEASEGNGLPHAPPQMVRKIPLRFTKYLK